MSSNLSLELNSKKSMPAFEASQSTIHLNNAESKSIFLDMVEELNQQPADQFNLNRSTDFKGLINLKRNVSSAQSARSAKSAYSSLSKGSGLSQKAVWGLNNQFEM